MKKPIILIITLISFISSSGQEIKFDNGKFASIRERARAEKKLIFIDFYTVWCGPCKKMDIEVFKHPQVAALYNMLFVNYKLDAEKGEGIALAKKYEVTSYPSFVFIDADGNLYNKSGGYQKDSAFIDLAIKTENEFNTPDNLVKLKAAYPLRKKDTLFLRRYIDKLAAAEMSATNLIEQYLSVQTGIPAGSREMMEFLTAHYRHLILGGRSEALLKKYIHDYKKMAEGNKDQLFFLNDYESWLLYNTKNFAKEQNNERAMKLYMTNWNALPHDRYERSSYTPQSLWMDFYASTGNWENYKKIADTWLDSIAQYVTKMPAVSANDRSVQASRLRALAGILTSNALIYQRQFSDAKDANKKGLRWMKAAIHVHHPNTYDQNAYADFLYRDGQLEEALRWKQSSLKTMGQGFHRDMAEKNLAHMQKGESLEN